MLLALGIVPWGASSAPQAAAVKGLEIWKAKYSAIFSHTHTNAKNEANAWKVLQILRVQETRLQHNIHGTWTGLTK